MGKCDDLTFVSRLAAHGAGAEALARMAVFGDLGQKVEKVLARFISNW
jgi:hypothetical protein